MEHSFAIGRVGTNWKAGRMDYPVQGDTQKCFGKVRKFFWVHM